MEGLNLFESNILLWIQENLRTDALDFLMPYVSAVNNAGLISILAVVALIAVQRYRKAGITAFFSLAMEFTVVNLFLKNLTSRIRPYIVNQALGLLGAMPRDYSFPSGHTGSAFAVASVLFLCGKDGSIPRLCGIFAMAAAVLIAVSRLYNAAHYPTDVFAGMVIGLITGVLAYQTMDVYERRRKLGD